MKGKLLLSIITAFLFLALVNQSFAQWTFVTQVPQTSSSPSISVVGQNTAWVCGGNATGNLPLVFRTTNGTSFNSLPVTGITPKLLWCIWAIDSMTAFVGDGGDAGGTTGGNALMYKTTNAGVSWTQVGSTGGTAGFINAITFSKTTPLFGVAESDPPTGTGQAYWFSVTTDGGNTWTVTNPPGVSGNASAQNAVVVLDNMWYGVGMNAAARVYFTSNGGSTWTQGNLGIAGTFTSGFAMKDDKLMGIAGTSTSLPNIARTTNGGTTWTSIATGTGLTGYCTCKWIEGTNMCYISGNLGTSGAIAKSTNGGLTWTAMTTAGLNNITHMEFKKVGSNIYGYAVAGDGTVLKLTDVVTGVQPVNTEVPSAYKLEQNYPNPFNPATTIKFSIPKASNVTLKVYSADGKEVASILNDYRQAGNYSEQFVAATNLSSGVYFYTITAGSFKDTKKFMLVK